VPYVVTQSCCADASCVVACPVNCLHPAPGEPGFAEAEMLHVDPETCVDCGACTTACPVGAIVPHTLLTPEQEPFLALNRDYYALHPHTDRAPLALVPPQRRLTRSGPFRVAVVGAGPAGLYTADELLKHPEVSVDVYDRLPTPYGLVRSGVAPDHQHTKQVTDLFEAIEEQPGFRYRLGIEVGRDICHDDLKSQYDAVIHAVGASGARRLGIEGEDLPGSVSATELTGWYNGRPDCQDLVVPLDHERAVVVGTGNVALDVARLLTIDPAELATTSIARLPETALGRSVVREVVVLGRRGPEHASFTMPELLGLRGLVARGALRVVVDAGGRELDLTDPRSAMLAEIARLSGHRGDGFEAHSVRTSTTKGTVRTSTSKGTVRTSTSEGAVRTSTSKGAVRTLVLRFWTTAERLVGEDRVTGLEVRRGNATEVVRAGLVVASVGFRGAPVPGLPFDEATGTVPHQGGRVEPGTYVVGWIKRGPRGFIGTNKSCAAETVESLLDDLDAGLPAPAAVPGPLPGAIGLTGWRAIDAEERRRGNAQGRTRSTIVDLDELRWVAEEAERPVHPVPAARAPRVPRRLLRR
jgi:ferredoxin--NADP+ reductase